MGGFLSRLAGAVMACAVLTLTPVHAMPWLEIGDAGDLPSTAQTTVGPGLLTSIDGNLAFDIDTLLWDIDLFRINVVDPAGFSARTVAGDPAEALPDPVLFLFGSDGRGVYVNDDIDLTTPDIQARLPAGHALGPLVPDLYYLGIGWAFTDPLSDLGPIFPLYELNLATDGVYGPTGSGGANPLTSWIPGGPPNFDLGGDYRILLTGAAVALLVPEPGSLALLGIAGLAAIARRRRNRS